MEQEKLEKYGNEYTIVGVVLGNGIYQETIMLPNHNFIGETVKTPTTDELGRNRTERKSKTYPKIRNNWKAVVVKICDRIANLEHSMYYNKSIAKMYVNEHDSFCTNLMSGDHPHTETNRAWNRLNVLVKDLINN